VSLDSSTVLEFERAKQIADSKEKEGASKRMCTVTKNVLIEVFNMYCTHEHTQPWRPILQFVLFCSAFTSELRGQKKDQNPCQG
jgi:hypothetical protein